jgi:hypothetical protein
MEMVAAQKEWHTIGHEQQFRLILPEIPWTK